MAEKIVHESIEPVLKTLDERIAVLEERIKMGTEKVETYTKEKPMMALGFALLIGGGLGLIMGLAARKSKN